MLCNFAYVPGFYVNVVQIQVTYYIADHTTDKILHIMYQFCHLSQNALIMHNE
jgi:hypothetical protein